MVVFPIFISFIYPYFVIHKLEEISPPSLIPPKMPQSGWWYFYNSCHFPCGKPSLFSEPFMVETLHFADFHCFYGAIDIVAWQKLHLVFLIQDLQCQQERRLYGTRQHRLHCPPLSCIVSRYLAAFSAATISGM